METDSENKKENEIKLDRKSKIFFLFFAVLVIAIVVVTYYRYIVKKDYIVQAQIDCDPTAENCFIWKCDPNSLVDGEECTGVPDKDIWYYKIAIRNAKNIPLCDPKDESCKAYVCTDGEKDCNTELCTPNNVKKGEECNDPVKYNEENPPKDNSSSGGDQSCAPNDESCQSGDAGDTSQQCDSKTDNCNINADGQNDAVSGSANTGSDQSSQDSGNQSSSASIQP